MLPKNIIPTNEEVKRRKSAQINNFPQINFLENNINTSHKSTSNLGSPIPLINSNSLFAYQELDQFSSFCDDGSVPSELLSKKKENSQLNNFNLNNSTKLEECEQSDSSDESDNNDDMSEDDIILKKNKQKGNKRKSAFYMIPSYLKNLSSFNVPNESIYKNNNIYNSDKKVNKNDINNNCINSNSNNFAINNGNCPYNIRRGSYPANQFRKDLLFNNILLSNQNNYIFLPNQIEANNNNLPNINNNTNQNMNNNTINFIPNIQGPNQNNFQNFNFVPNFPYNNNFFNNNSNNNNIINNQNINPKKRN